MNNLLSSFYYFKAHHPIRFWAVIGLVLIVIIIITIAIKYRKNKKKKAILLSEQNTENKEIINNEEYIDKAVRKENKRSFLKDYKVLLIAVVVQFVIIIGFIGVYLFKANTENYSRPYNVTENTSISSSKYIFGIDISHYQGKINWTEVRTSHHPIEYIFIRATMGTNGKDKQFKRNWKYSKKHNFLRGAYHYYRPNENSTKQFNNFKSVVELKKGDFVPVLDIEKESRFGRKKLREGVLNWLKLAEEEYGVKPIIYTGLKFYKYILKGYVDDYPLWIAAYSGKHRLNGVEWTFHQFTENVRVKGIRASVDGNDFDGDINELKQLLIK